MEYSGFQAAVDTPEILLLLLLLLPYGRVNSTTQLKLVLILSPILVRAYPLRLIHGIQRCFPSFYIPLFLRRVLCCDTPDG